MQRRTLALVCDLILDMMSAIGVSALVMVSLYKDYDVELGGFAASLWYDAKWFVQTTTELQILLVSSWSDLASRVVFSVGVLVGLDSIKDMLREVSSVDAQPTAKQCVTSDNSGLTITQSSSKASASTLVLPKRKSAYRLHLVSSFRKVNSLWERRVLQLVHGCLLTTGVVVLGLHLHAESIPTPHQCVIQVHPWAKRAPACLFVRLDCYHSKHSGELARVAAEWEVLDPSFARQLLVTHCSAFEVPPALQRFSNIVGLKMYNTTISRWDANAAITRLNHPNLVTMTLGRVNTTAGTLPPGLVSPDFPPQLLDVSFAYSNLHTVPDALATSWPSSAGFGCEVCAFTSIPTAVLGMRDLRWLAFANNPLTTFPLEAVTSPRLEILSLGGIAFPSFQLPDPSALASTALTQFYLQHSNLTYLPKWVDAYVSKRRDLWYAAPLDLTGTPFCAALAELRAGSRTGFPADWLHGVAAEEVSDWMTLARENVSAIDGHIECAGEWTMFYPTAEEDARYSL